MRRKKNAPFEVVSLLLVSCRRGLRCAQRSVVLLRTSAVIQSKGLTSAVQFAQVRFLQRSTKAFFYLTFLFELITTKLNKLKFCSSLLLDEALLIQFPFASPPCYSRLCFHVWILSLHLLFRLPCLLFPLLGCHSVSLLVIRLSCLLYKWPTISISFPWPFPCFCSQFVCSINIKDLFLVLSDLTSLVMLPVGFANKSFQSSVNVLLDRILKCLYEYIVGSVL